MAAALPKRFAPYRLAARLVSPWLETYTQKRLLNGKEDPLRLHERRGVASCKRPEGPLLWLHCASVGEFNSVLPLVEAFVHQGFKVLVTSITRTSAEIAARTLPQGALHAYAPWDVPRYGREFLDHWRPDLALFVESELWPNLIFAAKARGIPLVQLNARLSERSFHNWRRGRFFMARLLKAFSLSLAQSDSDAARLTALGATHVHAVGNLKYDTPAPSAHDDELARFRAMTGARKVWLAASTHPGEEEEVLLAFQAVRQVHPDCLLLIAPRHPERADAVAALFKAFTVVRRTSGAAITPHCDVFLIDTIGDLGLAYRLCPVTFIGGSLVPLGGHTPIEPAKCGSAIVSGPHVGNFMEPYAALYEGHGWLKAENGQRIGEHVARLLADESARQAHVSHAAHVVTAMGGGLARTLQALEPFLDAIHGKHGLAP